MAALSIFLFGPFQIVRNPDAKVQIDLKKAQALLAFLAVERSCPQRREALAGLLWPDFNSQLAYANLRQTLHQLRLALPEQPDGQPLLLCSPQAVQFNVSGSCWVDVNVFDLLIGQCRTHAHRSVDECIDCLNRLQQAAELYRGQFLAGLTLPDSAAYQEWVTLKQEEYHTKALNTLTHLARWYEQRGQYELADAYVLRQLQLEPWSEEAHRRRMTILALNGNRSAALQQFEHCRRTLESELGIVPAPETLALYERIRTGKISASASDAIRITNTELPAALPRSRMASPAGADHIPFVARERELAVLDQCLADACAGECKVVLIGGSRGSGKSTLIEQLIARAQAGTPGICIRCLKAGTLAQFASAFGSTINTARTHLPQIVILQELNRLSPEEITHLAHVYGAETTTSTLLMLPYNTDVFPAHDSQRALDQLLSELNIAGSVSEINLDDSDGQTWIDAFLNAQGGECDPTFRQALYQHTLGHPAFTLEVLQSLQQRGILACEDHHWKLTSAWKPDAEEVNWGPLPRRIEALIGEIAASLTPEQQSLLETCAVEGGHFHAAVAAHCLGLTQEDVIARLSGRMCAVQQLVEAQGVNHLHGQALATYRFRHPLYRQYFYDSLDRVNRIRLHEATSVALATLYGGEATLETAEELAHHCQAAEMWEQAIDRWHDASTIAFSQSDYQEAVRCLHRALALLPKLIDSIKRDTLELKLRLAQALPLRLLYGSGSAPYRQCCERAFLLSQVHGDVAARAVAYLLQAHALRTQGNYDESLALVEHLSTLAQKAEDQETQNLAEGALGTLYFYRGDFLSAQRHLAQVCNRNPEAASRHTPGRGLDPHVVQHTWLGWTRLALGDLDAAAQQFQAARLCTGDQPLNQAFAVTFVEGILAYWWRKWAAMAAANASLQRLCAHESAIVMRPWSQVLDGFLQCRHGETAAGLSNMRQGLAGWERVGIVPGRTLQAILLSDALAHAGKFSESLQTLEDALALAEATGEGCLISEIYRMRGEVLMLAINADNADGRERIEPLQAQHQAETALTVAIETGRLQHAKYWVLRSTISLYRLQQQLQQHAAARRLLGALFDEFHPSLDNPDLQDAHRLLTAPA